MPAQSPQWLPWLSPLAATLGAWFVGVQWLDAGFWLVLLIALACSLLPIAGYRVYRRVKTATAPDPAAQLGPPEQSKGG